MIIFKDYIFMEFCGIPKNVKMRMYIHIFVFKVIKKYFWIFYFQKNKISIITLILY